MSSHSEKPSKNISSDVDIASDKEYAIKIKNVLKRFGDIIALHGLNLQINVGETFGVLGPNGAGKTTLINLIIGLLKPNEGEIFVNGYDVTQKLKEIKEIIGVCPQEAAVYKFLTGRENIELFGALHGINKEEVKRYTTNLLQAVEFVETSERKAKEYSGGMLRLLNLLMALISDPKILFLDEPTVGMDPRARRKVWHFIRSLKNQNKTILLTTHYIEEAEALCDRVAIIDYGELIALGTPQELLEKYSAKNLEEVFLSITGRRIVEGI
ncbi:MAG: Doxorubicin resistance ATP-binding protein DrrA [Promethearchaeota archaeon]|nr:MAG: Doxorubicin resistance ATP-binding protein DrrA [Candidatus Lokiarchaeota archaeon]